MSAAAAVLLGDEFSSSLRAVLLPDNSGHDADALGALMAALATFNAHCTRKALVRMCCARAPVV